MVHDVPRSRQARAAAEAALIRVVHHYGARPEFVVLGGLVPELLCSQSPFTHAGTTDVDVQVDLEIAAGAVHTARLERALRNAEFTPEMARPWRWVATAFESNAVIRFEILADLDDTPEGATVIFDECDELGAANLRGTGYAARHIEVRELIGRIGGIVHKAEVNVSGLAGFLLAKIAAAHARRKPKDWYDIAFVLLHNDAGGPEAAAALVLDRFGDDLAGAIRTGIDDLRANFADTTAQGPTAYADQTLLDHPDLDRGTVVADAVVAVGRFCDMIR